MPEVGQFSDAVDTPDTGVKITRQDLLLHGWERCRRRAGVIAAPGRRAPRPSRSRQLAVLINFLPPAWPAGRNEVK
jgi:hypothetical protein